MIDIKNERGEVIYSYEDNLEPLNFTGLNLEEAVLEGVEFSYANLEGTNLKGADLYWAILFSANLVDANLENVLLSGADLKQASLCGADLRHANLGPDNLGGATELQGADLRRTRLDGTILVRAVYDKNTKFDDSFDPLAHGMTLIK